MRRHLANWQEIYQALFFCEFLADSAQRGVGNAQVRCDMLQWRMPENFRIDFEERCVALFGGFGYHGQHTGFQAREPFHQYGATERPESWQ